MSEIEYQYVAYTENREEVKGKLSASSEEAATNLLTYAGYQAINLKPFVPSFSLGFSLDKLQARLFPIKPAEVILFFRQLALLLESGTDIVASLELLQGQVSNRSLKKVLGEIVSDLRSGNRLSVALGKHPEIFPPMYSRSLSVGEQTGSLETILRQIADYMEKEATTAKSVKSALAYPFIVSIVAVIVIAILVSFVLPTFTDLYSTMGVELPLPTTILIASVDGLHSYGLYILIALAIASGLAFTYIKTPAGRYQWDRLLISLPLIGRISHLSELARCCRNISLLYRAGLPLPEITSLIIQGSKNKVIAQAFTDVHQDMLNGEGLSRPMAKNPLFLPMMVQMVRVGEETGNLDVTLLAVAQNYETEAEDKTRSLIGLIQPAMTIIIGLVVAFIAISLVSAMYSIYGQVL